MAAAIVAKSPPGHITHIDLDGLLFQGWVCDACLDILNRHGLQDYFKRHKGFTDYPPEEEIVPLLDLLNFRPMCLKCFQELAGIPEG